MGSAVSSVTNMVNNTVSNPMGAAGGGLSSVVSPIAGAAGDSLGAAAQGIIGKIGSVPLADQSQLDAQILQLNNQAGAYATQGLDQQALANKQLGTVQNSIGQTQGSINNAQQVNQGPGSNVNNAIDLLGQTASGQGPAQQAAQAQLQQGTDQAIKTQQAMANSGNLSQMISGQKTAMDNAASLNQQNANQAALLRANMSAGTQGQYAGAAGQQASQAAQNAGLQQKQADQQGQIYGQQLNSANNYFNTSVNASNAALQGAGTGLGIKQQALGQTGQNQAMAVGGLLNAAGGAASMLSDENTKTNIEYATPQDKAKAISKSFGTKPQPSSDSSYDSSSSSNSSDSKSSDDKKSTWNGDAQSKASSIKNAFSSDEKLKEDIHKDNKVSKFFDAIDPVTFKYKDPTGEMGKTPGEHIGVIAQQVENAPGGASMVIDTPKGKAIDLASAVGTLMAAAADVNDRMKLIEDVLKSKRKK